METAERPVRVRVWPDLACEGVISGAALAHVVGVAASHLDVTLAGVRRVFWDLVPLDAVEARQIHAAEVVVGGVVLHVEHYHVLDLRLMRAPRVFTVRTGVRGERPKALLRFFGGQP